jgi:dTDP-4-amino-4,6-dideoxygalactose transaminase
VAPSRVGDRHARRDALRAHLAIRGVETEVYYPLALHMQPCFTNLGGRTGDFPVAEATTHEALALPIHPALEEREIAYVIDAVRSFAG